MKPILLSNSCDIEDQSGFIQYLAALATDAKFVTVRFLGNGHSQSWPIEKITYNRYSRHLPGGIFGNDFPRIWFDEILYDGPFNPLTSSLGSYLR